MASYNHISFPIIQFYETFVAEKLTVQLYTAYDNVIVENNLF